MCEGNTTEEASEPMIAELTWVPRVCLSVKIWLSARLPPKRSTLQSKTKHESTRASGSSCGDQTDAKTKTNKERVTKNNNKTKQIEGVGDGVGMGMARCRGTEGRRVLKQQLLLLLIA